LYETEEERGRQVQCADLAEDARVSTRAGAGAVLRAAAVTSAGFSGGAVAAGLQIALAVQVRAETWAHAAVCWRPSSIHACDAPRRRPPCTSSHHASRARSTINAFLALCTVQLLQACNVAFAVHGWAEAWAEFAVCWLPVASTHVTLLLEDTPADQTKYP